MIIDIADTLAMSSDELALFVHRLPLKRVKEILFRALSDEQQKQAIAAKLTSLQLRSILLDVLLQTRGEE